MKKLSKLYFGLGLTAYSLFARVAPALAADGICPDDSQVGAGFNALCKKKAELGDVVQLIVNLVLFLGLVAALVFLIIGGIKWIMSGGDKTATENAKNAVTSALIGLAVVVGAFILINIILSFFGIAGGIAGIKVPTVSTFLK